MPDTKPPCAAALFEGDDLRLVWCNAEFVAQLDQPHRSDPPIGKALSEFAPLTYASRGEDFRRVLDSGVPHEGVDRYFSVEDGNIAVRWNAYPVAPETLLTLVEVTPSPRANG